MDSDIEVINGVILPSSINYVDDGDNQSTFAIKPLSAGFGTTLGNSLRRVLLSYIDGYAINYIRIPGVKHEFSSVDGMREDILYLVLNLKQVRFKKKGSAQTENIKVKINKDVFYAGDIDQFSSNFEIVNKNFEICHFNSPQQFEIELNIVNGEGWTPAKGIEPGKDEIGTIFMDSIFSPVKNVSINVSDARIGQQIGYDSLDISITTDGSLTPIQALTIAIGKLKNIFEFLSHPRLYSFKTQDKLEDVDIKKIKIDQLLSTKIEDLGFSRRLYSSLSAQSIALLKDVVVMDEDQLRQIPNFGTKSMQELKDFLSNNELTIGMSLEKYKT